jgi:hypothetical protein
VAVVNWIRRKKGLRGYARKHAIGFPKGFNPETNGYGEPAQELTRRVKRHAHIAPADPTWTTRLSDLIFPLSFGQLIARVAKAKEGVHEIGSTNTGRWVDIFLKAVYLPGGYAWCAAFAIWCHINAAIINDILDDVTDDYERLRDVMHDLFYGNAAYVPNLHRGCREGRTAHGFRAAAVAWDDVRAGDLIFCFNDGHVEVATGPVEGGYVPTCGGNTSTTGSQSNGGQVCIKSRRIGTEATGAGRIIPPKD